MTMLAAVGELLKQGRGHVVWRGGDDDAVEWRLLLPAEVAVAQPQVDVAVAEPFELGRDLGGQRRDDLDAVDVGGDLGQNCALVAGPSTDLQHAVARLPGPAGRS